MRLSAFSLALLLVSSTAAYADLYQINFTGSDQELDGLGVPNSYSESFTINTSALIPPTADDDFLCGSPADQCFVAGSPFAYYVFNRDGLIQEEQYLENVSSTLAVTNPASSLPFQLFTGPSTAPVISTGTFYGYEDSGVSYNPEGPLVITDLSSPSPVPEPGTFALLGTGAVGIAGLLRRRLLVSAQSL